jgi:hypothetical protein
MKLEGAAGGRLADVMSVGIQDRKVLAETERFVAPMHEALVRRVHEAMGDRARRVRHLAAPLRLERGERRQPSPASARRARSA